MSELSDIRDMCKEVVDKLHHVDKKIDTHVAETKIYRDNQSKNLQEHHSTLYSKPTGLIYEMESLKENMNQNTKHKALMATLFGVPIFGWLVEAALHKLYK